MTRSIAAAPKEPEVVEIGFVQGIRQPQCEMLDPGQPGSARPMTWLGSHGFGSAWTYRRNTGWWAISRGRSMKLPAC